MQCEGLSCYKKESEANRRRDPKGVSGMRFGLTGKCNNDCSIALVGCMEVTAFDQSHEVGLDTVCQRPRHIP